MTDIMYFNLGALIIGIGIIISFGYKTIKTILTEK